MPNWAFPAFPPYVQNGWFLMPTFPSRWWHPVLGSQLVADANAFALLDRSWSPTPGLADMRRTETEAELVITHDIALALANLTGATPGGTAANVNRRSASWQEVIDRGWQTTPLAAAKAPIGGPAPVTEGRAPGVTPPPGQNGAPFAGQARSEEVPPTAQPAQAQPHGHRGTGGDRNK